MKEHIEEQDFALLAGGELDARGKPDLARHLAVCPACISRLETYRKDRRNLADLRGAGVAAGDFDRVRHSVMNHLRDQEARRFSSAGFRWGVLTAFILISAALGAIWWQNVPAPPPTIRASSGVPAQITQPAAQPLSSTDGGIHPTEKRAEAAEPAQAVRIQRQRPPAAASPSVAVADGSSIPAPPATEQDDVVMKLETSDPNVIIIWLASPKGAGR